MFGRRKVPPGQAAASEEHTTAIPVQVVSPGDQEIGAKLAGPGLLEFGRDRPPDEPEAGHPGRDSIIAHLMSAYEEPGGRVHIETLLCAVGALSGFASQIAIRAMAAAGGIPADSALIEVQAKDGTRYYFGDPLNMVLTSTRPGQLSVWRLAAGAAVSVGLSAERLPDLDPIFARVAATIGTPDFGMPDLPHRNGPHELPRAALGRHWPKVKELLIAALLERIHWPLELAMAAQSLIKLGKGIIEPQVALLAVMDSAIMMSKVDPLTVPGGD